MVDLEKDIVKKQHFVPQVYLSAWENAKKQIEVFDKVEGRNFASPTQGIANKRYFYETKVLSFEQVQMIYRLWIEKEKNLRLKESLLGWLSLFVQKDVYQKFCESKSIKNGERWYRLNSEEKMYCEIEKRIFLWRRNIETFNPDFWSVDERSYFIFWLALQYMRTDKMQGIYCSNCADYKNLDNTENVFRWIMATIVANIIIVGAMKIVVFNNKTSTSFVTGDQPIINIFGSIVVGRDLERDEFELYYPISPNCAVLVSFRECYSDWQIIEAKEKQVEEFNKSMNCICKRYIYRFNPVI